MTTPATSGTPSRVRAWLLATASANARDRALWVILTSFSKLYSRIF
jgi:hypothetical protein